MVLRFFMYSFSCFSVNHILIVRRIPTPVSRWKMIDILYPGIRQGRAEEACSGQVLYPIDPRGVSAGFRPDRKTDTGSYSPYDHRSDFIHEMETIPMYPADGTTIQAFRVVRVTRKP